MTVRPGYKLTEIGEVPEEWEVRRLEDITIGFVSGGTPSTSKPEYWSGNIPWMRSAWISKRFVDAGEKHISDSGLKNSATNVVPSGNLLIATRVCIGNVALNRIDIAISQDLTGIVVRRERADPEYIYWVLKNSEDRIKQLVQGSTIGGVLRDDLKRLAIPLPSLREQQRIAFTLSSVDDSIEMSGKIIAKTQQLRKGVMHQLLTNGIGHTKFKETEIGRIPAEWGVVPIGAISKVVRGSTPRPAGDPRYFGGELPWITVSDLTKDKSIYLVETGARITEEGARRSRNIRPGTLLLGNSGFSLGVPKIAKISGYINDGIAALLDISPEIDTLFMYYCLASLTRYFRFVIARGVDQPNLNTTLISKVNIQLPPLLEQKEIAGRLSAIDHKIQNEEKRLETLHFLKKGLMRDLLTGKVRVKVS